MKEKISGRLNELVEQGTQLQSRIGRDQYGFPNSWIDRGLIAEYQSWFASAFNLIRTITRKDSFYTEEGNSLTSNITSTDGIPSYAIKKMLGLLISVRDEWNNGLLRQVEFIVFAEAFDDFLDHAAHYHKGNKKIEASVLASAVL